MSSLSRSSLKLLIGLLIFEGLPLAGWGGDVLGFLGSPARLVYVVLMALLQVAAAFGVPDVGRRGSGGGGARGQRLPLILLQVLSLALVLAAPWSDRRGAGAFQETAWMRPAGLVLLGAGFLLMIRAEAALGRQFSIRVEIQKDHRLVTEGPYRHLRHPRYAGILPFGAGFALVFRSWLGLILVLAMAGVLLARIREEEALLRRTFGPEWEAYSRRTDRLIPFVY